MKHIKQEMQEELRLIIHRFPLVYRACLAIIRDYGRIYYQWLNKKYNYSAELIKLKSTKTGKRCFIIGNGPSLRVTDLETIEGEDSFGSNRIYKIFDKTSWRPTYYSVIDWRGLSDEEINTLDAGTLFLGDYYFRKHKVDRQKYYVFYGHRLLDTKLTTFRFSDDISKQIYLGATVTYVNLQIAMYMGYKEIYLLGMDHNYAYVRNEKGNVVRNEQISQSHFFQDEDPSKNYGDMEGMTNAYITAKQYADAHGIKIYNATRGGNLEVFERVDFDRLITKDSGVQNKEMCKNNRDDMGMNTGLNS